MPATAFQVWTERVSIRMDVMQLSVFRTLLDIASGMQYLHSLGLIHGEPIDHGAVMWLSMALWHVAIATGLCTYSVKPP